MAALPQAEPPHRRSSAEPSKEIPLPLLYPLFFVAVYLSHITLLRLPYFWDEGGYYIPAALDFFRTGTLIPRSTLTNAHPPLPSLLLASWWHLSGFVVSGTRTLVCLVSAAALLGVYRLARNFVPALAAASVALLTAAYPVWFAQSTLATRTSSRLPSRFGPWRSILAGRSWRAEPSAFHPSLRSGCARWLRPCSFPLQRLPKRRLSSPPVALAVLEAYWWFGRASERQARQDRRRWMAALLLPILPLAGWYAFHRARTGFIFGNPEFVRYNATANLSAYRLLLCLWHRFLHLTVHMNLFVPVIASLAVLLLPLRGSEAGRRIIPRPALQAIAVVLGANLLAFSVLGGALLTRYLLPLYPLVLLLCVAEWTRRTQRWGALVALSLAGFVLGLFVNPPYAFAPEDNLTYRDMIVLHQQAAAVLQQRFPAATVLSAWPGTAELERPELGYVRRPFRTAGLRDFSASEMARAGEDPGGYDTAFLFSTKWQPPPGAIDLGRRNRSADRRFFDFHEDLDPRAAAALLHGEVVWQARRGAEWVAILRFPRTVDARLQSSILGW